MTKNTTTNYQNNAILASQDTSVSLSNATANFARFGSGMTAHLKAWITALQKANDLLPGHLRFDDVDFAEETKESGKISLSLIEQLEDLPVFALSVVVQKQALLPGEAGEKTKGGFRSSYRRIGLPKTHHGKSLKWFAVPIHSKTVRAETA